MRMIGTGGCRIGAAFRQKKLGERRDAPVCHSGTDDAASAAGLFNQTRRREDFHMVRQG